MNITEINLVQGRLNALLHQPVTHVGREADMLLVTFGRRHVLRVQCFYRLTEQGHTILARNDVRTSTPTRKARTVWTRRWRGSPATWRA